MATSWPCPACTIENPGSSLVCTFCDSAAAPYHWCCPQCRSGTPDALPACSGCGAARAVPAAPGAAPGTSTLLVRAALRALGADVNAVASALFLSLSPTTATPIFCLATSPPHSALQSLAGVSREQAAQLLAECGGTEEALNAALFAALAEEQLANFHQDGGSSSSSAAASSGGGGRSASSSTGGSTPHLARPATTAATLECPACMEDVPPSQCVVLAGCRHTFCAPCLRASAEAGRTEGKAMTLCPQAGCGCALSHRELRALLGAAAFQRLDRAQLEGAVALDPTLHICPTPDCTYVVSWASEELDGPPRLQCPLCGHSVCLVCKRSPFHEGAPCAPPGGVGGGGGGGAASAEEAAKAAAEAATEQYLRDPSAGIQRCVQCHVPISMTFGWCVGCGVLTCPGRLTLTRTLTRSLIPPCPTSLKMKCRCGYRFCWQCGTPDAKCGCTPANHGFWDAKLNRGDFS